MPSISSVSASDKRCSLGNLSTIGLHQPDGFVHVLLDNGVHDSTGGQPTNAAAVDFPGLAMAAGYSRTVSCATEDELESAVEGCIRAEGPSFIYVRIRPGSINPLPRPDVSPEVLAKRFSSFLASSAIGKVSAA